MATSPMSSVNFPSISSPISTEISQIRNQLGTGFRLSKTSFFCGNRTKLFSTQSKKVQRFRQFKSIIYASSSNHIPKQFRQENLKEGLMENYKNVPQHLFGLSPSQMNLFTAANSPILQQSEKLKEESISSARSYMYNGGMLSLSSMTDGSQPFCSMNTRMAGDAGSYRESTFDEDDFYERNPPPDLPSLLLHNRIVYLGMPIVPQVTELIVAQLLYLDFIDVDKPLELYINCPGTRNHQGQVVASEIEAYAIADALSRLKCRICTVNIGWADGQAAMLLSIGTKGYRYLLPNATVTLYLPGMGRMNGQTSDIYIEAKELQAMTTIFLDLLSKGTGKPPEVLREDIRRSKCFGTQETIDYGIADKLIGIKEEVEKKAKSDYEKLEAKVKARAEARAAAEAANLVGKDSRQN